LSSRANINFLRTLFYKISEYYTLVTELHDLQAREKQGFQKCLVR